MQYNNKPIESSGANQMPNNTMSMVRVLHAVPDAPSVDVYANDIMIARNLAYGQNTSYLPIPPGSYQISLFATGTKDTPVLSNMLNLEQDSYMTIAAEGTMDTIGLLAVSDSDMPISSEKAMVRFLHLSPNAPAVDITLTNGTALFRDVSFKEITPYLTLPPMNYTLQVRPSGTNNVVLTVPNVNLEANKMYTIYAIGLAGGTPDLTSLLLVDG